MKAATCSALQDQSHAAAMSQSPQPPPLSSPAPMPAAPTIQTGSPTTHGRFLRAALSTRVAGVERAGAEVLFALRVALARHQKSSHASDRGASDIFADRPLGGSVESDRRQSHKEKPPQPAEFLGAVLSPQSSVLSPQKNLW